MTIITDSDTSVKAQTTAQTTDPRKPNIRQRIYTYSDTFFRLVALLVFFAICFATLIITVHYPTYTEAVQYKKNVILSTMLGIAMIVSILALANTKKLLATISYKTVRSAATAYLIVASVTWAVLSNSFPDWDSGDLIAAATQLGEDYTDKWAAGWYMERFPYQAPYVMLIKFIQFFFGENQTYLGIELFNSIAAAGTGFIVITYSKAVFGDTIANITAALTMLCFPIILYVTFAYGNLPAIPFAMAGFLLQYKAIKQNKFMYNIYASLLVTISIMLKSTMLVALIAMCIGWIIEASKNKGARNTIAAITAIIIYASCMSGFNTAISHKYQVTLDNGLPKTVWIAMGLQNTNYPAVSTNAGGFNGYVWSWPRDSYDPKQAAKDSKESIQQSLLQFISNPPYAIRYFSHKEAWIWCDPTYESLVNSNWTSTGILNGKPMADRPMSVITHSIYYGKLYKIILFTTDALQTLTYMGTAIYLVSSRKKHNLTAIIPVIACTGTVFIYILWEVKAQYSLPVAVFLLPFAAAGCKVLIDRLNAQAAFLFTKVKRQMYTQRSKHTASPHPIQ